MIKLDGDGTRVSGNMFLGPPRLYQELEELQHDLDVVEHVSHMVGSLQGTYQVPPQLGFRVHQGETQSSPEELTTRNVWQRLV